MWYFGFLLFNFLIFNLIKMCYNIYLYLKVEIRFVVLLNIECEKFLIYVCVFILVYW